MAATVDEYNRLCAAIHSGVLSVSHNGRTSVYRSLAEMHKIRDRMAAELGLTPRRIKHVTVARVSDGRR